MAITFAFCLGDMDEVLASPTGYPYIQVFYNATQSLRGANAMVSFVIVIIIAINLTTVASASRQLVSVPKSVLYFTISSLFVESRDLIKV